MVYNLWGVSPLYENELLQKGSIPAVISGSQVLGEGNCGSEDRPWEGSPRMRSLSRPPLRSQPHSRPNSGTTDRNLIQGRIGQASEPIITKPFSFSRFGKSRATMKNKEELPVNSDRGAVQQTFDFLSEGGPTRLAE